MIAEVTGLLLHLGLVVVGRRQWLACRALDGERVMRSNGVVTAHPVFQVAAYWSFFMHWLPAGAPELDVRAVVVPHYASAGEAPRSRTVAQELPGSPPGTARNCRWVA
ncbi:hypothetical protein [Streptomyces sp. NPDC001893]|uniref:hypothetical protein n=1 Tax=Streptomyces sp. NPDC001893 TaxID=3154530 RepID=UPI00331D53C4